jgi:hypothetical protein
MTITKLAYNLAEAAEATGMSKDVLRRAIRKGDLRASKSGVNEEGDPVGNYVILVAALQDYLDGLPAA